MTNVNPRLPEPTVVAEQASKEYLNQLIRVLRQNLLDIDSKLKELEDRIYELENP